MRIFNVFLLKHWLVIRYKIGDIVYELTDEKKTLSRKGYTGKNMKIDTDVLMINYNMNDVGCTATGDFSSKRERVFTEMFPKKVAKFEIRILDEDEYDDLQGERMKNINPSKLVDVWTRLKVLLRLNLSGLTDTLTEASYLIGVF